MSGSSMFVLDPTAKPKASGLSLADRPASIQGATVGLLDNGWQSFGKFLNHFRDRLIAEYGVKDVVYIKKTASSPAPKEAIDKLADNCQVVINGLCNWGSCTTWSVHDGIELEKRGIPTITVATTWFQSLAETARKSKGLPDLPIVLVPHPFDTLSDDEVIRHADAVLEAAISAVVSPELQPVRPVTRR